MDVETMAVIFYDWNPSYYVLLTFPYGRIYSQSKIDAEDDRIIVKTRMRESSKYFSCWVLIIISS